MVQIKKIINLSFFLILLTFPALSTAQSFETSSKSVCKLRFEGPVFWSIKNKTGNNNQPLKRDNFDSGIVGRFRLWK